MLIKINSLEPEDISYRLLHFPGVLFLRMAMNLNSSQWKACRCDVCDKRVVLADYIWTETSPVPNVLWKEIRECLSSLLQIIFIDCNNVFCIKEQVLFLFLSQTYLITESCVCVYVYVWICGEYYETSFYKKHFERFQSPLDYFQYFTIINNVAVTILWYKSCHIILQVFLISLWSNLRITIVGSKST